MKPNVLIILADQFRYDCVGSLGKNSIKTPYIDALAQEGRFYTNAYTPTPVCSPARQALLSGRQADSFGALWNWDFIPTKTLPKNTSYWTKELQRNSYKNTFIGKWNSSDEGNPYDFGFEKYISVSEYNAYIKEKCPAAKYKSGWLGEKSEVPVEHSKTHWLADKAIETISEYSNDKSPWHLRLDFTDPHLPCRPSEPFASMYNPKELPEWESFGDTLERKPYIQRQQLKNWGLEGMSWEDWSDCVSLYYGMISQLDDAVGKVLNKLKELNILDDTLIIFTSDHGDTCGGHGMIDKHYILYDDVTHVPFIIRYPKLFPAGKCDDFVSNCLDIAPTIEELCCLSPSGKRHGKSLLHNTGRDFSISTSNGQQFGLFTQRSIRTLEYKYIWNLTDIDEFYCIQDDPGEKANKIYDSKYKQAISSLRKKLYYELLKLEDPFALTDWLKVQLLEDRKI